MPKPNSLHSPVATTADPEEGAAPAAVELKQPPPPVERVAEAEERAAGEPEAPQAVPKHEGEAEKPDAQPESPVGRLDAGAPPKVKLTPRESVDAMVERAAGLLPDLPVVVLVLLAGAFGGWLAFHCGFLPLGEGQKYSVWAKENAHLSAMLLGAVGAGVTVFFVAKTDTRNLWHCIFFAVLCGMAGQSLIQKALGSVNPDSALEKQVDTAEAETGDLRKNIAQGNVEAAGSQATVVTREITELIDKKPKTTEGKEKVSNTASDAIAAVAQVARLARNDDKSGTAETALNNLREIAVRADDANRPAIAQEALAALQKLSPARVEVELPGIEWREPAKIRLGNVEPAQNFEFRFGEVKPEADTNEARIVYYHKADAAEAGRLAELLKTLNAEIRPELQLTREPGRRAPRDFRLRLGLATLERLGIRAPVAPTEPPRALPAPPAPGATPRPPRR